MKEITTISALASRQALPKVEQDFYCRAGVAIFYAHWEGYVKRAATYYLKYISFRRLSVDEMADFVLCFYIKQTLGREDLSSEHMLKFAHNLGIGRAVRPFIAWKDLVSTQSNLSSKVFRAILEQIGIDYSPFATKANLIDGTILKARNSIAHGDQITPDVETVQEIGTEIIGLITSVRDYIENAVALAAYRRA